MTDLGEWDEVEPASTVDDVSDAGDGFVRDAQTYFPSVVEWAEQWLFPMWRRKPERWCPSWWRHPEAVARLDALWQAWEELRRVPGVGPSTFLRDHLDPHMAVLTSNDGPFARCTADTGHGDDQREPLPFTPTPAGYTDAHAAVAARYAGRSS